MSGAHAVYGVRVAGLRAAGPRRACAPPGWDTWTVEQVTGEADDAAGMTVTLETARVGLPGAGEILIDRAARTITFRTSAALAPEAILHPGLVPAAAIVAWWMGRVPMHASSVVHDGRAFGLLADREGGKSTTAALLADRGCSLFTDDMLIVEGARAFAGPGSVDLRREAAAALGGRELGTVGERERWRKPLEVAMVTAPVAGWIELAWAQDDRIAVTELSAGARVRLIERHASLPLTGEQLLDLAAQPMVQLRRPRGLARAGEAVDVLLDVMRRR